MYAIRAPHAFDGETFRPAGATLLIDGGLVAGVENYEFAVPDGCELLEHHGTILPGLIDTHTHLVADSGDSALGRVAGYTEEQLDEVISKALADQLAAGVTTVRDPGDRRYCVVERRDRQTAGRANEPTIAAAGPPLTSKGGHCDYLGGEVTGREQIITAVAERVDRSVDVVKVMVSGGVNTPGTDVLRTQFSTEDLRLIIERAHTAGLPVTAHAHGTPAVEQAVSVGVDGIEHCSCITERGYGQADDTLIAALASSGIDVCPTIGVDPEFTKGAPPPAVQAMLDGLGLTPEQMFQDRWDFVGRLHRAGVNLVSGADSGLGRAKRHGVLPFAVCELLHAGFTPAAALITATSSAAAVCGLGNRKGRLAAGFDADLLLVEGDLETDLGAVHRITTTVLRGQAVTAPGLR